MVLLAALSAAACDDGNSAARTSSGATGGSGAAEATGGHTMGIVIPGRGDMAMVVDASANTGQGGGEGNVPSSPSYELPVADWPSDSCVERVDALLGQMSVQQKAAQMVMGSYEEVSSGDVSGEGVGTVFSPGSSIPGSGSASDWASLIDELISAGQSTPNEIPVLFGVDAVHRADGQLDRDRLS